MIESDVVEKRYLRSSKWQLMKTVDSSIESYDRIPYTVAEMEWPTDPTIIEGLKQYLDTEILGYTNPSNIYYESIQNWTQKHYGYTVSKENIVITPGVISSIRIALHTMTSPQDNIVLLTPSYNSFFEVIKNSKRNVLRVPLINSNGHYSIDFMALEEAFSQENTSMFVLCSPHNPIGRIWSKDELIKIYDIAKKHKVIVLSDEIHCDLIMPGYEFVSYRHIDKNAIVLTSITKTFNLAGLKISNAFIPDASIKDKWESYLKEYGGGNINAIGMRALELAYSSSNDWLRNSINTINDNYLYIQEKLKDSEYIVSPLQATYLLWIDGTKKPGTYKQLRDKHFHVGCGMTYGSSEDCLRVNIAVPKKYIIDLVDALLSI